MNRSQKLPKRFRRRPTNLRFATFGFLLAICGYLTACGYHVAGRSDALPKSIHTIAVPALENATNSYRIEQKLTSATVHEFLAATPYKIYRAAKNPLPLRQIHLPQRIRNLHRRKKLLRRTRSRPRSPSPRLRPTLSGLDHRELLMWSAAVLPPLSRRRPRVNCSHACRNRRQPHTR